MIQALPVRVDSVRAQQRARRRTSVWSYLIVVVVGLLIGVAGSVPRPDFFLLAFGVFACGAVAILVKPVVGIYLIVFFTLIGDRQTFSEFPFKINFSGPESILYIHDALTFSPLEVYLVLTAVSWIAHVVGARDWHLRGRPVLWPVAAFGAMVGVGVVYGVGATGGDRIIAFWELRPLLYLVAMFVLASNLLTRTADYVRLAWLAVLAVSIQNIFSIHSYFSVPPGQRETLEALTEHPASVMYAWVFILTLAVCMFRGSVAARVLLVLATIPTLYVFVLSERRAAFVALAAGFLVFALVMLFRRRRAFFVLMPIVLVMFAGYSAAFWNATGGVGFGARAVKTVFASSDVSERDSSSDVYRNIENYDLVATIHAEPLTGVGFGKPFHQPIQLPDISVFALFHYIPHNSILWIWLKMGFVGFVVLLFAIAATLRAGTRAALQVPQGNDLAVTVGALAYVMMLFVFAYVDIAWDARSSVFLAVCMATCANMLRLNSERATLHNGSGVLATQTSRR